MRACRDDVRVSQPFEVEPDSSLWKPRDDPAEFRFERQLFQQVCEYVADQFPERRGLVAGPIAGDPVPLGRGAEELADRRLRNIEFFLEVPPVKRLLDQRH